MVKLTGLAMWARVHLSNTPMFKKKFERDHSFTLGECWRKSFDTPQGRLDVAHFDHATIVAGKMTEWELPALRKAAQKLVPARIIREETYGFYRQITLEND